MIEQLLLGPLAGALRTCIERLNAAHRDAVASGDTDRIIRALEDRRAILAELGRTIEAERQVIALAGRYAAEKRILAWEVSDAP